MSEQDHHRGSRIRIARFVFQAGFGAVGISLVWCFLTSVEWRLDRTDLLPLILFGVALPWLVIPIPAHIISSATASGRFLMSVTFFLALLTVAVSIGRLVFSWDRVLVVLLSGLIISGGVLAQSIWGRIWVDAERDRLGAIHRDGILTFAGWTTGIIVASLISVLDQLHYGLWFGAIAMIASAWLIRFVPRKSTSANWLSNRSALRLFAAIENAARSRRSRLILLRVFWFSGGSLSLFAMIPGGWTGISGESVTGGLTTHTDFIGMAMVSLILMAGLAFGSLPKFVRMGQSRPSLVLVLICLMIPASAFGMVLLPSGINGLPAFFLGTGIGAVMEAASRDFRKSLGTMFITESEVLLWTVAGAGGVAFSSCFWLAHSIIGFGPLLLTAEFFLFGGFAVVWRHQWTREDDSTEAFEFDPWYPGRFKTFANPAGEASLFSIAYEVSGERREAFSTAIRDLAHLRQRQGALFWTLAESAENPDVLKEQFIIESLSAYQDAVRSETSEDREIKQRVFDLNDWDSLPCESRHRLLEA